MSEISEVSSRVFIYIDRVGGILSGGIQAVELRYKFTETVKFLLGTVVDIQVGRVIQHPPYAYPTLDCGVDKLFDCGVADSSCRIVDDTTQGFVIIRIGGETEICDGILHLLSLIE